MVETQTILMASFAKPNRTKTKENNYQINKKLKAHYSTSSFFFVLAAGIVNQHQCLKLTQVVVPTMVPMGKPFWLNCSYELDNQGLYSIKWYHWNPDSNVNGEFYRWLPNDTPPGQMFPMKGIHLDKLSFRENSSESQNNYNYQLKIYSKTETVSNRKTLIAINLLRPFAVNESKAFGVNVTITINVSMPIDERNLNEKKMGHNGLLHCQLIKNLLYMYEMMGENGKSFQIDSLLTICFKSQFIFVHKHTFQLDRCNFGHVYFTKSDIFTDGSFRCEVSAEAPSFKTVRKEMELHVYSLPSGKPTIKGLGPDPSHYGPGDLINVECHSKPSRPAAKISWLINGEMINPKFVKTIPGPKQMDGLQSTRSEISFYSERSHYRNGLLKIHCIAKIDQQYDVHTDKILIGEPTKSANGHQTNVGKAQSSLAESMERDMPYISGFKNGPYRVGEYLNLTCVAKGKTAPRLTFFVNDVEANASQIRPFSVIRVSDGLFASKLMLEFAVEPNESPTSTTLLQSKRTNHVQSSSLTKHTAGNGHDNVRPYRIECMASMEKNIYTEMSEVHLGTSKQSSGLHLAGNFAVSLVDG
ncbi:hypothetical protein BLOT_011981, partial [Blomia tropicalis]